MIHCDIIPSVDSLILFVVFSCSESTQEGYLD